MQLLDEIRSSDKKPKALLVYLLEKVKRDKSLLKDFSDFLKSATAIEKGILMEILEYASKDDPNSAVGHLDEVINHLSFDAPRVKWEAARVIANLSQVRWSSAFALGEIAKYNKKIQVDLVKKIEVLSKKEQNNGVKNVYLKALKIINFYPLS